MSNDLMGDELWSHFAPLWSDLKRVQVTTLLVAGGYGLFLKQRFLLQNPAVPIVVPLERWREANPRVTKDLDLVIGLDLIGSADYQKDVLASLTRNGFVVSEKPSGKRWQFVKSLGGSRAVLVELHAPLPDERALNVVADKHRVKHKPSLHDTGIHGRTNPEAVGSELFPFRFELNGTDVIVVNPITWSVMKLTAMDDRWIGANSDDAGQEAREFSRQQAFKHAQDVCRILASMTRDEGESTDVICQALRGIPSFTRATTIWQSQFVTEKSPAVLSAKRNWLLDDFEIIKSVGSRWFL